MDYSDCMPGPNVDHPGFWDRCMNILTHPRIFDWEFYAEKYPELNISDECSAKVWFCLLFMGDVIDQYVWLMFVGKAY